MSIEDKLAQLRRRSSSCSAWSYRFCFNSASAILNTVCAPHVSPWSCAEHDGCVGGKTIPKYTSAAQEQGKNRTCLLTLRAELSRSEQQFASRISFVRIYSPERCEQEPGMIHNLRLVIHSYPRRLWGKLLSRHNSLSLDDRDQTVRGLVL